MIVNQQKSKIIIPGSKLFPNISEWPFLKKMVTGTESNCRKEKIYSPFCLAAFNALAFFHASLPKPGITCLSL